MANEQSRMRQAAWVLAAGSVLILGAWLRFQGLGDRPFHADEATGARILAARLEGSGGSFDPTHFHGPLLGDLAIPLCRAMGETTWLAMEKHTLRCLPAGCGTLLVALPLLAWAVGRRWREGGRFPDRNVSGWAVPVVAAACLATSPLLVYYSRMFIHEMLLTTLGVAWVVGCSLGAKFWRTGLPGVLLGLMFATKETFGISVIAWLLAAWVVLPTEAKKKGLSSLILPVSNLLLAGVVAAWCYSDGWRHPAGIVDAVRTFFVYQTGAGHEKSPVYYADLLVWPHHALGVWWSEVGVLGLAILGALAVFRRGGHRGTELGVGGTAAGEMPMAWRMAGRFLAVAAAGHFAIYSVIGYKTPWLACLPWAHVCLLAGFAVAPGAWSRGTSRRGQTIFRLGLLWVCCGVWGFHGWQAWLASTRFASDARNRLAYVPTRPDLEKLVVWLGDLRAVAAPGPAAESAVIGKDYWPLPWYLRGVPNVGYGSSPPPGLEGKFLVFAMPSAVDGVMPLLEKSHVCLPRGLRAGVPLHVFVRNDCWSRWMRPTPPP